MTTYCWHCYCRNDQPAGVCRQCGMEISAPADATLIDRLLWGSRHPDPDVAMIAVHRLAGVGDSTVAPALRRLVENPPDPYVGAEALRSLLAVSDVKTEVGLLEHLAEHGSLLTRLVAVDALQVGGR